MLAQWTTLMVSVALGEPGVFDITPLIKAFPLREAVGVLCGAAAAGGRPPAGCPKKPSPAGLTFFGKPAK